MSAKIGALFRPHERQAPIIRPATEGGVFGGCRSCGQKSAHILADIAGWNLQSQVSSPNFVDPLPATRAVGRCEATDAIPTGTRRRRPIPRRSGRIPAMVCVVSACASVRLCRSLPSFAFHLASPVICRERASRRERDGSMQSQPGAARATVRACRMCKYKHPTLAHSDGNRASS